MNVSNCICAMIVVMSVGCEETDWKTWGDTNANGYTCLLSTQGDAMLHDCTALLVCEDGEARTHQDRPDAYAWDVSAIQVCADGTFTDCYASDLTWDVVAAEERADLHQILIDCESAEYLNVEYSYLSGVASLSASRTGSE